MNASTVGGLGGQERSMREDMDALRADLNILKTDLKTFASDAASAGKHGARFARDKAGEAAQFASDKAKEAYSSAKERGREAAEKAEETIVEHPFASVGVAFAVGLVLGALISRR